LAKGPLVANHWSTSFRGTGIGIGALAGKTKATSRGVGITGRLIGPAAGCWRGKGIEENLRFRPESSEGGDDCHPKQIPAKYLKHEMQRRVAFTYCRK